MASLRNDISLNIHILDKKIKNLGFFSQIRILNVGFVLPKRPHLHRPYLVSGPKLFLLSVSEKEHYFGECKGCLTGSTDGLRLVFSLVSFIAEMIWE